MKPKILAAACILFLVSLALQYGPVALGKSRVVRAIIVEETAARSGMPQDMIILLQKAPSLGVATVDQNLADDNPPADLVPFLNAAKGKPLPQLTRKWASGQTTSVACPTTLDKLKEAVQ